MNVRARVLAGLCLPLLSLLLLLLLACGPASAADDPPMDRFTQIRLLVDNDEAWQAKRALIDSARTSLDLAYFIVEDDASTRQLLQDLVAASQRQPAVRVRLLVDYFMTYRHAAMLQALAAHPGIEVRRRGAPSDALRAALQAAGVDGPRFIAGLATSDPRMVMAAVAPSPLFPAEARAALAGLAQQPAEALGARTMQVLHTLAPQGTGAWRRAPEVRAIAQELHRFLHWTHHKLLLADNRCFIMGGRNLADAYHRNTPATGHPFQDTDVHACDGSGTSHAQRAAFDALWATGVDVRQHDAMQLGPARPADAEPDDGAQAAAAAPQEALVHHRSHAGTAVPIPLPDLQGYVVNNLSAPGGDAAITRAYTERIRAFTARGAPGVIDIVNAYVFLSAESASLAALKDSLLAAARAGITVNLRTNSLASTDLRQVNRAAYQTLGALIAGGVRVYELQPGHGSLHTKAAAIGEEWLLVGSYNLDPRSELYDSNNLLVLRDDGGRATAAFRKARVECGCWKRLTAQSARQWKRRTQQAAQPWKPVERLL